MWLHWLIAGITAGLLSFAANAQLVPIPISQPAPVQQPMKLMGQLRPYPECGESCDSKAQKAERAEALKELGVPSDYFEEARVTFEDLDGDGVAEAIFTIDVDGANVVLAVLKQKNGQWYRLPSPEDFSCWCKYETSPLDSFIEIAEWSYSFDKAGQPRRLMLVHSSGGGTGLYERRVEVFALDGLRLRKVFANEEEDREFPLGDKYRLKHALLTFEGRGDHRALVIHRVDLAGDKEDENIGPEQSWWVGKSVAECNAYTWSINDFSFVENPVETSEYCRANHAPPSTNKSQHH
jgi:hypothetical protein